MGFSRQEYWSRLPFPSPGDPPGPGIEPALPSSPALADGFFITEPAGKPQLIYISNHKGYCSQSLLLLTTVQEQCPSLPLPLNQKGFPGGSNACNAVDTGLMPGQANNACLVYILFIVSYIAILPDSSVRWLIGFWFFFFFTYQWSTPEIKQLWSAGQIWLATHFCGVLLEHCYIHSSSLVCDCPGTTRVELSD